MKKSNNKNAIATVEVAPDGEFRISQIDQIRISPDNRKRFNEAALRELAASIKADGVAQPILIRPVTPTEAQPEPFEIVAGERRYRASKIAGLTTIPTMVRPLSDLQAAKIRILENLQREDPHAMEEATGYEQLMLTHGYNADQLAEEIKKSKAYVYGRLKLCALTTEVREQFLNDKISPSTALIIARIAVPALQLQAYKEIVREDNPNWHPMSYREAVAHIQGRYMLDLTTAPFQLNDIKLLAAAGSCTACPKRTGNQPEVFVDVSADVCTDPDCFAEKRGAVTARLIVQANKKGIPVLETSDAVSEFVGEEKFVVADQYAGHCLERIVDSQNYYAPLHKVLADLSIGGAVKAYKKSGDKLVPIYEVTALQSALEKAGVCESIAARDERQANPTPTMKEASAKQVAAAKAQQELTQKADDETTFRVELYKRFRAKGATGFSLQSLREFTKLATGMLRLPDDLLSDVYAFDTSNVKSICAHIDQAELPEIQLILIDLLVGESLEVGYWDLKNGHADENFAEVLSMAKAEGIDPDAVREELFPSPIDISGMDYDDLVKFIKTAPNRINELANIIKVEGCLVGALERAAKACGFKYTQDGFVLIESPAPAEMQAAPPAGQESSDVDQLATVAEAPKAKTKQKLAPAAAWPFPKTGDEALASRQCAAVDAPNTEVSA
jgi:ParB/RepB/Spo0J family partition protein